MLINGMVVFEVYDTSDGTTATINGAQVSTVLQGGEDIYGLKLQGGIPVVDKNVMVDYGSECRIDINIKGGLLVMICASGVAGKKELVFWYQGDLFCGHYRYDWNLRVLPVYYLGFYKGKAMVGFSLANEYKKLKCILLAGGRVAFESEMVPFGTFHESDVRIPAEITDSYLNYCKNVINLDRFFAR